VARDRPGYLGASSRGTSTNYERVLTPRLKDTWGHQLAHALVIHRPLQLLYRYDRASALTAAAVSPGMEWCTRLPTV
jgi:hypothetical protein